MKCTQKPALIPLKNSERGIITPVVLFAVGVFVAVSAAVITQQVGKDTFLAEEEPTTALRIAKDYSVVESEEEPMDSEPSLEVETPAQTQEQVVTVPEVPVEEPAEEEEEYFPGSKAYGEAKFVDFNRYDEDGVDCGEKVLTKGTIFVNETGLEFVLTEDVRPTCIRSPRYWSDYQNKWYKDDKLEFDEMYDSLSNGGFDEGARATLKGRKTGERYEIAERSFLLRKDRDPEKTYYIVLTNERFRGGDEGGLE